MTVSPLGSFLAATGILLRAGVVYCSSTIRSVDLLVHFSSVQL